MSEKKEETKAVAKEATAAVKGNVAVRSNAAAVKTAVIYIGPSIKNVVSTNTIYNNGLPEILQKEKKKQPVIGSLIVPVDKLAQTQRELRDKGSAMSVLYSKVITE